MAKLSLIGLLLFVLCILCSDVVSAKTRHFNFTVQNTNVTRLCYTKSLLTVNGEFPGPTSYVREGDKVVVNVTNLGSYNLTIHWHGVRQFLSCWADGPAYITQCPIQTGQSYVHRFQIIEQRGTLFWHAHQSWLRASVYGAFIILEKKKAAYPHKQPSVELPPLLLGEWWNANVEDVIAESLATGGPYNISDALTINGQPGDLYNCSSNGTAVYNVTQGETIMLRLINAAMNFHLYFAVANHSLTIVEGDAEYIEPYVTDVVVLSPGQTTNVVLTSNQSMGQYYIAASVFSPANMPIPFPTIPTTAILNYNGANATTSTLALPTFPAANDTTFVDNFYSNLRGMSFKEGYYYYDIPKSIDIDLLHTVGYALQPCPIGQTCVGPNGTLVRASISNITFISPSVSLLQAFYSGINHGIYTANFPDVPLFQYDYTAVNPDNKFGMRGTQVRVIPFNSTVQVVWQNTATLLFEQHPIHLHGQNFYIVGQGNGTYNASIHPLSFNLANPVYRNTVSVPAGGWAAVRFRAVNPGVWFVHCHFDLHTVWGMDMAFITLNGVGPDQTLPPPPSDFPMC